MLITKAIERKLLVNQAMMDEADQRGVDFSIANLKPVVKLFNPMGSGTWFLYSMDENSRAFGWAKITSGEYGYVDMKEMQHVSVGFGLGIERDLHYTPETFNETIKTWG
jgi:hypothetical protein